MPDESQTVGDAAARGTLGELDDFLQPVGDENDRHALRLQRRDGFEEAARSQGLDDDGGAWKPLDQRPNGFAAARRMAETVPRNVKNNAI